MEKEGRKPVTLRYGNYMLGNQRLVSAGTCCKKPAAAAALNTSFTGCGLQSKGEGEGDISDEER